MRRAGLPLLAALAAAAPAAHAADPPTGLWQRDTLTGDWGGARPALKQAGVTVTLSDSADLLANLSGGIKPGTGVENEAFGQVDADLGTLLGWPGAHLRVSAFDYAGRGVTEYNVGSLLDVSSIEAAQPSARILEAWLEQDAAGGAVAARAGLLALDAAGFATTQPGTLFIGATYGAPGGVTENLPLGGPAYPLSAPGVLLTLTPGGRVTLMAGVLAGDPGGLPGATFPPEPYPTGTVFSTTGGVLAVAQATLTLGTGGAPGGQPAVAKLGGWYDGSRHFTDLATVNAPRPVPYHGDWGLWATIEGQITRALSGFMRATVSPPAASLIDRYADAGLVWKGLLAGRGDDLAGFAIAWSHVGAGARAADRMQRATDPAYPVRDAEIGLELTWQAAVAPWWTVQPVLQYWVHPGGNVPNADGQPRGNAVVAGLRTQVTF